MIVMDPMRSGIKGIKAPRPLSIPHQDKLMSTYAWHPNIGDDNLILRVSKSSMSTFQFCEQQYFIKYILGVKEEQNDDMLRGTNVHDAMEDFYDTVDLDRAGSDIQSVRDHFYSYIPHQSKEKEWGGETIEPQPFELGERIHLQRMMDLESTRFMHSDKEHFLPVINEDSIDAIIDLEVDGQIVFIHLTGIIDRGFMADDGRLHLHELKTGKWKDSEFKLKSMQKEMAFYVYMLKHSKNHKYSGMTAAYWGWDHTKGDSNNPEAAYRFAEPVRTDAIQDMLLELQSLVRMHLRYKGDNAGTMFPRKADGWATDNLCEPWCRVKGFCPKYGRVLMPADMKGEGIV